MATPSTLSYGIVVGQFLVSASDSADADALPDAVPASGTVTFTPSAGVVLDYGTNPNPSAILRKPIVASLDPQGYLIGADGLRGVRLIATDNPTVKPVGWTWVATYALKDPEGNDLRSLTTQPFLVPSGTTTDLIVAMPIEESKGVFLSKGDKGDKGDPNTLSIASVLTSGPGQPAEVSISGVSPNQALSFTLPRGDVGPVGPVGPQGIQGFKGDKGDTGSQGIQGEIGLTGPQGIQGEAGDMVPVAGPAPVNGTINITTAMLPSTRIWTLTSNITVTLPTPGADKSGTITLILKQDATGNRTFTWPASVKWTDGIIQQPATAPNSTSAIHLLWTGTEWLGLLGGKSFA